MERGKTVIYFRYFRKGTFPSYSSEKCSKGHSNNRQNISKYKPSNNRRSSDTRQFQRAKCATTLFDLFLFAWHWKQPPMVSYLSQKSLWMLLWVFIFHLVKFLPSWQGAYGFITLVISQRCRRVGICAGKQRVHVNTSGCKQTVKVSCTTVDLCLHLTASIIREKLFA